MGRQGLIPLPLSRGGGGFLQPHPGATATGSLDVRLHSWLEIRPGGTAGPDSAPGASRQRPLRAGPSPGRLKAEGVRLRLPLTRQGP